ncbi:MAG TPA: chemotaxis-specific protein-glutamate methyltransferase CheB [Polyangiaceae bacterium]|jgi:two-component system chemotaxis response regulator CheB|nr:chemotaxis-specific protein-glutamate methyltransferase CheB [Polyangiaceae bacterium]
MTERPIRLLIVDDSAFARKVIRELVSRTTGIEIVGIARDGLDALEQCAIHQPDVITLDLMMPDLDGIGVLRALSEIARPPEVVVVSSTAADSRVAVEALQLGAVAIVQKPTASATDRLYEVGDELIKQVKVAASVVRRRALVHGAEPEAPPSAVASGRTEVVVVGTSTGGPHALTRLLSELPSTLETPLAAVVHIPVGYTSSLAERIDHASSINVVEASEGLQVRAGTAVIARAGVHLYLERAAYRVAVCRLSSEPHAGLHRPSVDVLFSSAAAAFGANVLGIVLTGMGDDGLEGSRAIRVAGGTILTEHPSSSVVDGMPRAVREAGLSNGEAALGSIGRALLERL